MTFDIILKSVLIGLIIFSIIFFIIGLAKVDFSTDVEKVLSMYKEAKSSAREKVEKNNNIIDNLNKEILKYKKK